MKRRQLLGLSALTPLAVSGLLPGRAEATSAAARGFAFGPGGDGFRYDGKPLQIRSGELHPSRIPVEYWRHRIRMARAMGLNTVSIYLMWNYLEPREGRFDFTSERRDFVRFCRIAQQEGMHVLLRPGPYVCGEWDAGGLPSYLLADPDAKVRVRRATYPPYLEAVSRYVRALAPLVRPLLSSAGGPVLMLQVENEYGSFGSDSTYLQEVQQLWVENGIPGPFYTEDGLGQVEAEHTNLPGGAIALSGGDRAAVDSCRKAFPDVPAMAGEVYPGWLTHWGDGTFATGDVRTQIAGMMQQGTSFNLYMVHGGTSFGFYAGANANDDGSGFVADITSYDYEAPITEQGGRTTAYDDYRDIIATGLHQKLPTPPAPIRTLTLDGLRATPFASIWDNLPGPAARGEDAPRPMESHGQDFGLVLYRAALRDFGGGTLVAPGVHDYATAFVDGAYQGGFARQDLPAAVGTGVGVTSDGRLDLDATSGSTLDLLVEGMGRNNYGAYAEDRKGLIDDVSVERGGATDVVRDWATYRLPMDGPYLRTLRHHISEPDRPGIFFRCGFVLSRTADTYVDLSEWAKGLVWVNGQLLGRYWSSMGPQHALYCPAPFLKRGHNDVLILDLHRTTSAPLELVDSLR